jgi:hypothetical protein
MRDPDLMQRADRAAIALEQAWERWREMHGLGAEPLPPVSSYVGYSLEEPWGQPRVVFGLRADEAELLTSLLEGHDCVGSVYSELSARSDWRLPVSGPVSMPGRGYSGPLSVPAQAPPPGTDPLPPGPADGFATGRLVDEDSTTADELDDEDGRSHRVRGSAGAAPATGRAARAARPARTGRRTAEAASDGVDAPAADEEDDWSAVDGAAPEVAVEADAEADATAMSQAPPLAPLPDMPGPMERSDEAMRTESAEPTAATPRAAGNASAKTTRGPGYRGPRYQGFPPRYEASSSLGTSAARPARAAADENRADGGAEPASIRKTHAAKLSRSARRRTQGG